MKILNTENLVPDRSKQKIFLGEYSGFQRFDYVKYPFAKNIEEKMRQSFWNPNEISLINDRIKFPELPNEIQEIIIRNLLFQTLMDSAQSRGLDTILSAITTDPTWEGVFRTQGYFEQIHSLSYSHILREVFPDATKEFDRIQDIKEIHNRLDKEIISYHKVSNFDNGLSSKLSPEKFDLCCRQNILDLIIRIFTLESLKFYVSFLVTYAINEGFNHRLQGITRIIKLINFDEDMHVSVFSGLIGILKNNVDEGFSELFTNGWFYDQASRVIQEVVNDELQWGQYLLSIGNIPSITSAVLKEFIQYYADKRLNQIGCDHVYNTKKNDIVTWFDNYKNIDLDNVAAQESTSLAYNIGILKNDLNDNKFEIKRVKTILEKDI